MSAEQEALTIELGRENFESAEDIYSRLSIAKLRRRRQMHTSLTYLQDDIPVVVGFLWLGYRSTPIRKAIRN